MANGSNPMSENKRQETTLGDTVRQWVDELIEGLVELMSPPPVPVPVRRRSR